MDQGDLPAVIITLVVVFAILFTGTLVANHAVTSDPGGETISTDALLDGNSWTTLGDNVGSNETVNNSLGNSLELDSGEFQSESDVNALKSEHWGVSTWATVDVNGLNDNMSLVQMDDSLILYYDGTGSQAVWRAWYYDYTDPQTVEVEVNATDPEAQTNLQVIRDGTTITLYRNANASQSASLTGDKVADSPDNLSNWDGTIEELRAFTETPTASQHNKLHDEPLAPLPGIDTALRIYFDQQDGTSVPAYFSGGELQTTNATLASGFKGSEMTGAGIWNDLTGSTDYRWDTVGPKIKAVDGGSLDGAPVAFVTYDTESNLETLADDWNQAMGLAGVLFVLLPLGVVVIYLRSSRGGR